MEFLGHYIHVDVSGVQASPSKVKSITECQAPAKVAQLQSFSRMIQYHSCFILILSPLLHLLNKSPAEGKKWMWTPACEEAFNVVKEQLTSATVLTCYKPDLELHLATIASPYRVGSVITHTMPDGTERPIAFASRTLSSTELEYAQLEREALTIIFGIKKFHRFSLG